MAEVDSNKQEHGYKQGHHSGVVARQLLARQSGNAHCVWYDSLICHGFFGCRRRSLAFETE